MASPFRYEVTFRGRDIVVRDKTTGEVRVACTPIDSQRTLSMRSWMNRVYLLNTAPSGDRVRLFGEIGRAVVDVESPDKPTPPLPARPAYQPPPAKPAHQPLPAKPAYQPLPATPAYQPPPIDPATPARRWVPRTIVIEDYDARTGIGSRRPLPTDEKHDPEKGRRLRPHPAQPPVRLGPSDGAAASYVPPRPRDSRGVSVVEAFCMFANELSGSSNENPRLKYLKAPYKGKDKPIEAFFFGVGVHKEEFERLTPGRMISNDVVLACIRFGVDSVVEFLNDRADPKQIQVIDPYLYGSLDDITDRLRFFEGGADTSSLKVVVFPFRYPDIAHIAVWCMDVTRTRFFLYDSSPELTSDRRDGDVNKMIKVLDSGFQGKYPSIAGRWTFGGTKTPMHQSNSAKPNNCGVFSIVNAIGFAARVDIAPEDVECLRDVICRLLAAHPVPVSGRDLVTKALFHREDKSEGFLRIAGDTDERPFTRNTAVCLLFQDQTACDLEKRKAAIDELKGGISVHRKISVAIFSVCRGIPYSDIYMALSSPGYAESCFNVDISVRREMKMPVFRVPSLLPPYVRFLLGMEKITPGPGSGEMNVFEIMTMSDKHKEEYHSFIQYLFPFPDGRGNQPERIYIQLPGDFVNYLNADRWFFFMVVSMCQCYLQFVGIRLHWDSGLGFSLADPALFHEKLGTGGHNVMRFSRMLRYLCSIGQVSLAVGILGLIRSDQCVGQIRNFEAQYVLWLRSANAGLKEVFGLVLV